MFNKMTFSLVAIVGLALAACAAPATQAPSATQPTAEPVVVTVAPTMATLPTAPAEPTSEPVAATAAPATTVVPPSEPAATGTLRFEMVPQGSEARYRVNEQLAGRDLPNDAVGVTQDVSGAIVVEPDGTIVRDQSKIVVNLESLTSDQSRRDNFIRGNTLETSKYPTAEFVPTEIRGLSSPLPTSGEGTFELVGDLTVRGVTRPTTWQVTARMDGEELIASATTSFTFGDFNMTQPRVPVVLSVKDLIQLEIDLRMKLAS
jgi:polyisoprenoid-binding protein YceI